MNKDKAIQLLERLQDPEPYEPMLTKDAYDAIQMAIDALSANGDTISRKAAIDALDEIEAEVAEGFGFEYEKWRKYFCDLPSAQSDVPDINVGDTISRQAVLVAVKDALIAWSYMPEWRDEKILEAIAELPPAQPEPANNSPKPANDSGELIDRQMAIDAVCMEWCNVKHQDCKHPFDDENDDYYWCDGCETVLRTLPDLPSAQPERIKARWILAENQRPEDMENDNYLFVCSNCGSTDLHSKRVPVPYCWNCGAEMLREVAE